MAVHLSAVSKVSKLDIGNNAPEFTLEGDDGKIYSLSDFSDQKVVLYFYPLDNSYNCTKQACSVAQRVSLYEKYDIKLFGINHQSVKTHLKFKKKHHLPFILLSDPSCTVIKAYGVYSSLFVKRITFLIDRGIIVAILDHIDLNHHGDQILKAYGLN